MRSLAVAPVEPTELFVRLREEGDAGARDVLIERFLRLRASSRAGTREGASQLTISCNREPGAGEGRRSLRSGARHSVFIVRGADDPGGAETLLSRSRLVSSRPSRRS